MDGAREAWRDFLEVVSAQVYVLPEGAVCTDMQENMWARLRDSRPALVRALFTSILGFSLHFCILLSCFRIRTYSEQGCNGPINQRCSVCQPLSSEPITIS